MGLSDKACEAPARIDKQRPDIAGGVRDDKEDLVAGAGDQGIMVGYACVETEACMPLSRSMATRLGLELADVRKCGLLWWLRPGGTTQVTIEYLQRAGGSGSPGRLTRSSSPRRTLCHRRPRAARRWPATRARTPPPRA